MHTSRLWRACAIALTLAAAACADSGTSAAARQDSPAQKVAQARALLDEVACHDDETLFKIEQLLATAKTGATPQVRAEGHVEQARLQLIRGSHCTKRADELDLRLAANELKQALTADPDSTDAWIQLGRVYTQQERYAEAAAALDRAAASTDPQLHVHRALLHTAQNHWAGAEASLDRVPRCRPEAAQLRQCGGKLAAQARIDLYQAMGNKPATLRAHQEATHAFPQSAFMHGNYAHFLLHEMGDIDGALAQVELAERIRPNGPMNDTHAMALFARWAQLRASDANRANAARQEALTRASAERVLADAGCGVADNPALQGLLQAFADTGLPLDTPGDKGNTALITAAACGDADDIRWLLAHGASTEARNAYGANALLMAAGEGKAANASALLSASDLDAADPNGNTALQWAAMKDHTDTALALITGGADVNQANKDKVTPLMWAAQNGNAPVVRALLEAGAHADTQAIKGWTALSLAQKAGHQEVVKMLQAQPDAGHTRPR